MTLLSYKKDKCNNAGLQTVNCIKGRLQYRCFPGILGNFENAFLTERLLMTASFKYR